MKRVQDSIRPTMVPVEPVFENIEQEDPASVPDQAGTFTSMWFRFPRLRRQKGLATGIIGLW
jgi:hypothetical protein